MNNTAIDPKTMTPAEIDNVWLPLQAKLNSIYSELGSLKAHSLDPKAREADRVRYARYYDQYKRETAAEIADLQARIAPFAQEWQARQGWTRYRLCISDGGHVHTTEYTCSTLRPTSRVAILPDLSGLTEAEMVDVMGFKACTVCYPFAPSTAAWARTEKASADEKAQLKADKYAKGLAMRVKKVVNAEKRLAKVVAANDTWGLKWATDDVTYAKRELARWEAKA